MLPEKVHPDKIAPVWHEYAEWRAVLTDAEFRELDHYYRPAGVPHAQQAWVASAWRKSA